MKKILLILGLLVILSICSLAYTNHTSNINISFYQNNVININFALFILGLTIYAGFGTFLTAYYFISCLQAKLKKQTRTTEKASIESQESSDKVRILQAKIDTLEIALKEALLKK